MKKGAAVVITVGVLALVVVLGIVGFLYRGSLFTLHESTTATSQQQPVAFSRTPSAGKKLYHNEEFGFSFEYPDQWPLTDTFKTTGTGDTQLQSFEFDVYNSDVKVDAPIFILSLIKRSNETTPLKEYLNTTFNVPNNIVWESVQVGGTTDSIRPTNIQNLDMGNLFPATFFDGARGYIVGYTQPQEIEGLQKYYSGSRSQIDDAVGSIQWDK